ncbi:hypothetical protein CS022_11765 [Veronia nyctiphanis]|uniref:Protein TonB n=1 Tax=Veronia nyctiphanis TaxID=1278244 RepID=A0A4V1LSX0_9GAMM|nr:energy transducer TonB [Veronia nyctiphanis]RXJ73168.1 hypothetical protein CS022_11765 [Veronia nyctiphanis]
MKGIEGYVVVSFRLGTDGRPRDAKVVEAKPRRVFEREALRAVRQWQYARPKAGANIDSVTTVRLEFTLSQ